MVGTRHKFNAGVSGIVPAAVEGRTSRAENDVAILPAQHRTSGGGGTQNPGPFVGGDLLVGSAAQFIEGRENGAQHDFKKRGVLIVHQDVRLDHGKEPGQGYLNRIEAGRQSGSGEAAAIIGQELDGSGIQQGSGSDDDRRAHLRRAGAVHNYAGNFSGTGSGVQGGTGHTQSEGEKQRQKCGAILPDIHRLLPPLWLRSCGGPNAKVGGRGYSFFGKVIGNGNFQLVVSRRQRAEGDDVLERELFAMLRKLVGANVELQHRIRAFILGYAIFHGGVGLVGFVVDFEVVDLQENAHLVAGAEVGVNARADFHVAEDELAEADVVGGDALNLVGQDQGAGGKAVVFEARNRQASIDHADVAVVGVLQNDVQTVEARRERNRFLINRSGSERLLERGGGHVAPYRILESVDDAA